MADTSLPKQDRRDLNGFRANGTPKDRPLSPGVTKPVVPPAASHDGSGRAPMVGLRETAGLLGANRLPPIGVLLVRPLLLALCAVLGAMGGYLLTAGDKGSVATATIAFSVLPNEEVALEGATLQRTIAPPYVLQKAANSLGEQTEDLQPRTTVVWQQGTRLLNVTVTAATGDEATQEANAVANAAVAASDDARNQRLAALVQEANSSLLTDPTLDDPAAEVARRTQIGATLGERENQIQAQSMSLIVVSPAAKSIPVGLSKMKGTLVGLASGLLAGAILAVLLGSRGLRVPAPGAMRRLAPELNVLSPSDLPLIVGQLVEAGETLVVVIATRGASLKALAVSENLQRLLAAHGKSVTIVSPDPSDDPASFAHLRADSVPTVPSRHTSPGSLVDTDMVLLNVDYGTEAASMFEGRAGFSTVVVLRRRKTPLSSALAAHRSYSRSPSSMIVA